jgi:hypothetical protein
MMSRNCFWLMKRISFFSCIFFILGFIPGSNVLVGDDPKSVNTEEFIKSIRQLESQPDRDEVGWHQAESALDRARKNPDLKEKAICGLAWLHLKRGNTVAVGNLQAKLASIFPAPSADLKSQLGRIQLYYSLAADPDFAQEHFAIVAANALDPKVSESNRMACAAMLGAISGMLKPGVAESPIDRDLLNAVRANILKSPMPKVIQSFEDNLKKNDVRSTTLAEWLAKNATKSEMEKSKLVESESENLKKELEEQTELLASEKSEEKELQRKIFALTKEKTNAKKEVNLVDSEWDRHPEYHNPILPNREQFARGVRMGETEFDGLDQRTVFRRESVDDRRRTFADTVTFPRYRWNPRPQHLIDRDIDGKYLPAIQRYQYLSSQRDSLRNKKAKLTERLKEIETELGPLVVRLESISELLRSEMKGRKEIKVELDVCIDAAEALRAAKPSLAFRPPNFDIVDYSLEAKVLKAIAK